MTKRTLLAGLLGGVAMFIWASLAHTVLPLGRAGVQEIPNEPPVLAAMHASLGESSGLYIFPGMGLGPDSTSAQRNAAMQTYDAKLAVNPSGFMVYHPAGAKGMTPAQLGTEFATEVLEAVLVVFLLAQTRLQTFAARVGFVTTAGVLAVITTNISYWNWYGFPNIYTVAYMTIELVGFVLIGIVAAVILKKQVFI